MGCAAKLSTCLGTQCIIQSFILWIMVQDVGLASCQCTAPSIPTLLEPRV